MKRRRATYFEVPAHEAEKASGQDDDMADSNDLATIPEPQAPERDERLEFMRPKGGTRRSYTISSKPSRREVRASALVAYPEVERPRTRGDCEAMPRPCPFVSCLHHLYLDVNPDNGHIKINYPHLEVWELKQSCSLDVADRGGLTLEECGDIIGLTRERIRQVEYRAIDVLKREFEADDVDALDEVNDSSGGTDKGDSKDGVTRAGH